MTNPQIVPVKTLEGAKVVDNIGLVDIEFHPVLPWLFSAGSDGEIRLYV
jgi:ribosome biogenesis protein ERB1